MYLYCTFKFNYYDINIKLWLILHFSQYFNIKNNVYAIFMNDFGMKLEKCQVNVGRYLKQIVFCFENKYDWTYKRLKINTRTCDRHMDVL